MVGSGQEARLLKALDDIRVSLVGKLEQIRQELELQRGILAEISKNQPKKPEAIHMTMQAIDAKSVIDHSGQVAEAISKSVSQSQVKPQFPGKKK